MTSCILAERKGEKMCMRWVDGTVYDLNDLTSYNINLKFQSIFFFETYMKTNIGKNRQCANQNYR